MHRYFRVTLLLIFLAVRFNLSAQEKKNAIPVQQQLDAYNAGDIAAFLKPYSEDVKVYNHPNDLIFSGKTAMRERYGKKFASMPDLHCTLENRMVLGNVVIDQEYVIQRKGEPATQVIAMYKIRDGKIHEVYFIRPENK